MKINVTQPCPTCKGKKMQIHPSWLAWANLHDGTTLTSFFRELGYLPLEPRPPIIIACRRCRGNGEVEAWLPLEALLPDIFGLLRRHFNGAVA